MVHLILTVIICLFTSNSFATSYLPTPNQRGKKITEDKKNWEFGLGFTLGYSTTKGLVIGANPSAQYFLMKNLSVGGFINYYHDKLFSHISAGPSATYFIARHEAYSIIFSQKLRFREYIKPDDFEAAKTVSVSTLAADWRLTGNLSMRLGVSFVKSLDNKSLSINDDKKEDWVFPALGLAYYL